MPNKGQIKIISSSLFFNISKNKLLCQKQKNQRESQYFFCKSTKIRLSGFYCPGAGDRTQWVQRYFALLALISD